MQIFCDYFLLRPGGIWRHPDALRSIMTFNLPIAAGESMALAYFHERQFLWQQTESKAAPILCKRIMGESKPESENKTR